MLAYDAPLIKLYQGDCLDVLKALPSEHFQCVVTSPPYFGLRDYGIQPSVWGGDEGCQHEWGDDSVGRDHGTRHGKGNSTLTGGRQVYDEIESHAHYRSQFCQLCGAWLGALGQEPTPELYVEHLVDVFREVRRVMRQDAVLFLNLGDSYFGDSPTRKRSSEAFSTEWDKTQTASRGGLRRSAASVDGLKPKDLCMIPARVALALQADGWWLRSDIIWSKPNPMPESVTDRPTKAHEYVFLLTKSARYFYDAEAIREPSVTPAGESWEQRKAAGGTSGWREATKFDNDQRRTFTNLGNGNGRNRRTVWTIATTAYPGSHFATFPKALVEPCVLAGTSARGCCPECGKPWERVVQKPDMSQRPTRSSDAKTNTDEIHVSNNWAGYPKSAGQAYQDWRDENPDITTGWRPTCSCPPSPPAPCRVLDPFAGTATVGEVCLGHRRAFTGIELNGDYIELALQRLDGTQMGLGL